MDIKEALNNTVELVQNELILLFEANGMKREQLGSFGKLFYNEFDNYLTNAGKRIRPFLTITASVSRRSPIRRIIRRRRRRQTWWPPPKNSRLT